MSFLPVITQVGLNAAVAANDAGASIELTHIAVGDVGWTPDRTATALQNQRDKVAITGSTIVGQAQRHLTALFQQPNAFAVREVGFYLADGTLFAVWSHPVNVLFYQTPLAKVVQGFDLLFVGVPTNAISVNVTGDLNIYYADAFYSMALAQTKQAVAQLDVNYRQYKLNERLLTLGV